MAGGAAVGRTTSGVQGLLTPRLPARVRTASGAHASFAPRSVEAARPVAGGELAVALVQAPAVALWPCAPRSSWSSCHRGSPRLGTPWLSVARRPSTACLTHRSSGPAYGRPLSFNVRQYIKQRLQSCTSPLFNTWGMHAVVFSGYRLRAHRRGSAPSVARMFRASRGQWRPPVRWRAAHQLWLGACLSPFLASSVAVAHCRARFQGRHRHPASLVAALWHWWPPSFNTCLTRRSTGPATAGHAARTQQWFIMLRAGGVSCRVGPVSSTLGKK